jgi:hypothetical protein
MPQSKPTYCIRRFFRDGAQYNTTIKRGLTLEEAHEHCNDLQTSSRTATNADALALTKEYGPWFSYKPLT